MSILKPAKILGAGSGEGSVTVEDITDASTLGKSLLKAEDGDAARRQIAAMGTEGDQVLDGKLQLNHQLVLKSVQQTDANVIAFYFGEDDGVVDVAIKATGTTDNHGQIAISVRDDSGNLINAITVDGNSKAVLFQPGYKIYIGNSAVDISNITSFGGQLIACQDKAAVRQLLGITE